MKVTSWKDAADPGRCEQREHERSATSAAMGRSSCVITCPFCGTRVWAYVWSLSGGGKRCPCGAIHGNYGKTFKLKEYGSGEATK